MQEEVSERSEQCLLLLRMRFPEAPPRNTARKGTGDPFDRVRAVLAAEELQPRHIPRPTANALNNFERSVIGCIKEKIPSSFMYR